MISYGAFVNIITGAQYMFIRKLGLIFFALLLSLHTQASIKNLKIYNLETNDIIYDEKRDVIYASVSGTAKKYGNSIIKISPKTGEVIESVYVGSEPTNLAITSKSEYLYTTLNGAGAIRRITLDDFKATLQFPVSQNNLKGLDIATIPNSPKSIIVVTCDHRCYHYNQITLFDDNIARGEILKVNINSPGDIIVTADSQYIILSYIGTLKQIKILADGLKIHNQGINLAEYFSRRIKKIDKQIITNSGKKIDPINLVWKGTYTLPKGVQLNHSTKNIAAIKKRKSVFLIGKKTNNNYGEFYLYSYNMDNFTLSNQEYLCISNDKVCGKLNDDYSTGHRNLMTYQFINAGNDRLVYQIDSDKLLMIELSQQYDFSSGFED